MDTYTTIYYIIHDHILIVYLLFFTVITPRISNSTKTMNFTKYIHMFVTFIQKI